MHLENLNPGKKNTKVSVMGVIYQIGPGGFICDDAGNPVDVPQKHAERLLQGPGWQKLSWDPSDPKNAGRLLDVKPVGLGRAPRSAEQMRYDQKVKPKTREEMGSQTIGTATGTAKEDVAPSDDQIMQSAKADQKEAKKEAVKKGDAPVEVVQEDPEPEPEADPNEWPDPTTSMDLDYLRQMADAYEVAYTGRTGKKRLVKDIMAAMYSED